MVAAIPFIPLLPLFGALMLLLFPRWLGRWAGIIASTFIGSSFAISVTAFAELIGRPEEERVLTSVVYDWISVGSFNAPMAFRIDPLSVVMLLVVTGVGTLIHVYSIGYMSHDERQPTFFAYLNLFAGSMLILVLGANFLVMFLGWELVGVCSYLLISFWKDRPSAAAAGKKAFIVNRVGDFGFLIAIFLIFHVFGSLDFETISSAARHGGYAFVSLIPLLLLLGATGKSAQIPLHVWLPDAMEGPTPVSALIHAATMVTAGVYMIARAHVLFEAAHGVALAVVVIGIATAFFAATIALTQNDIKRVLAYSTVSQLGYMFVGVGVGALTGSAVAYTAAIFHLVTHAFFKALLFLGAGSVMHAVNDETDMKKMGGLLKPLPITGATFIIGWLAISGVPPLAGFFSKEAILASAWEGELPFVWILGVLVAGLTSFYMSRQVFLTFFGRSRVAEGITPHESPSTMTIVLRALAVAAALGGLINLSAHAGKLTHFLEPVFGGHEAVAAEQVLHTPLGLPELIVSAFVASVSLAAIYFAYVLYLGRRAEERRASLRSSLAPALRMAENKYYVDEAYNWVIVWPGKTIARMLAYIFDPKVIDGAVNGVAGAFAKGSEGLRHIQTGLVRRHVLVMFGGAVLMFAVFIVRFR